MLSKITGREVYKSALNQFMNWLIESAYRTPKGLVWLDETSPNGFAGNYRSKIHFILKYKNT